MSDRLTEDQRRLLGDVEANRGVVVPASLTDLSWSDPCALRTLWDEGLLQTRPFGITPAGREALDA